MRKYLVRFTTTSGGYDKEWCWAHSEEEAENKIRAGHWNIQSIDLITEI